VIFTVKCPRINSMDDQDAKSRWPAKRFLWIPFGFTVAALGTVLGISLYAAYSMTKVVRAPFEKKPDNLGLKYVDVSFPSRDGLTLRGWWLEAGDSSRAVVMVHGANGHRADSGIKMLDIAREMVNAGYNVLMFDLRGHGQSEGEHISLGYYEQRDLLGAIDYVKQRGMSKIGVIGFSMGAATALMTAASCKQIDAIVADSSFAYLADIVEPQFSKRSSLPKLFIPLILFVAKKVHGIDLSVPRSVDAVKQFTTPPILIIHGGQDKTVPVEHASILARASRNPNTRLWIVPEAEHVGSYRARPKEYITQVLSFFDQALS
jgi:alpha-beta hydrolase superfamily lysophospholipase